ncbi:MAG: IPT/TIG domain-containing protein, partial [Acidimicrobiales bacterium]
MGRLSRLVVALFTVLGVGAVAAVTGALAAVAPAGAASGSSTLYVGGNEISGTITSYGLPTAGGNISPSSTLTSGGTLVNLQMAFDASGNLWSANTEVGTITQYTSAQLAAGGTKAPNVTVTANDPDGLAFTGAGDLWVASWTGNTLTEYKPTQLTSSGNPTPAVTITSDAKTPPSLDGPENVALDASGDLWVANSHSNTVVEYTPTQLAASGAPVPAVTITSKTTSLGYPRGLAFSSSGNLWVSSTSVSHLVEYTPAQLATGGALTPAVTISSTTFLWTLAFDNSGDLWASKLDTSAVSEYSASQLTASGSPTPAVTIAGTKTGLEDPLGLAIKQPPTVTSLSPATGPERGGTTVTVHGTGFTSASKVSFGSSAATTVKVTSPFTLTAVAPKGLKTVTVTVGTFSGTSAPSAGSVYTYVGTGYDLVGSDGGVFVFPVGMPHGFYGSLPSIHVVPNKPVVGMVATVTDTGYFLVGADGGVFAFTAPFLGS